MARRGTTLYFRRKIPLDLRTHFGRTEVWVSLRTANLWEARVRLVEEIGRFEERVRAARAVTVPSTAPKATPTRDEVDRAVRAWLLRRMEREEEADFGGLEGAEDRARDADVHASLVAAGVRTKQPQLTTDWIVSGLVEQHGWAVEQGSASWGFIARRVGAAEVEVARRVSTEIGIPVDRAPDVLFEEARYKADAGRLADSGAGAKVMALYDAYVVEANSKPSSQKAARQCLSHFVSFLGHANALKITPEDVVRWKQHLLVEDRGDGSGPRDPRTIRDKYLATVRALFRWAAENRKLPSNPAAGITVRVKKKPALRGKSLTDDEAAIILRASTALGEASKPRTANFARRWVPWLLAYSGARVNEITQLRAEDVSITGDVWCIRITPEAGSQKNDAARIVPLHPHIIEQGFDKAITGMSGPLFYDPRRHKGGSEANPQYKKVGEHLAAWVRKSGVDAEGVQPNHGWRHRFKTEARRVRMDPEIRDGIQGHVPRTEGEAYGDRPLEMVLEELKRLPRYAH